MTDQPAPDLHDPFADLDPDDYVLTFKPVAVRARRDGWSEDRQRRFILALRAMGVVAMAARAVGSTVQGAYRLRARPDGGEFAAAWDRAMDEGRARAFSRAMERAVEGYDHPRHYRGQVIGHSRRFDDRMTMAVLTAMGYPKIPPVPGSK